MDKTLESIGDRLRHQMSIDDTVLPERMRRLVEQIAQAEQRARGRERDQRRSVSRAEKSSPGT